MNTIPGRGSGFGSGLGGWGRRNWFYATGLTGRQRAAYGYPAWGVYGRDFPYAAAPIPYEPSKEQEMDMLKNQAKSLEDALSEISKRIQELEAEKQSKK